MAEIYRDFSAKGRNAGSMRPALPLIIAPNPQGSAAHEQIKTQSMATITYTPMRSRGYFALAAFLM